MKPQNLVPTSLIKFAVPLCLGSMLVACDGGGSAVFTAPVDAQSGAATATQQISLSPPTLALDSASVVEAGLGENDSGAAATLLVDRSAIGPVRIMATGDSITHGIVGASSYRETFASLMTDANCSFEMVGSQTSSLTAAVNTDCVDTGEIGDGWGWDGSKSCMVDAISDSAGYQGAHEGYSAHRADHFLTGHVSSAGSNAGISASMTANNPDVVLLHVGSVDLYHEQTVASTLVDIKDVIDVIYETNPQAVVLIANVIPWFSANPYAEIGKDIKALGNGIERMVASENNPLLKLVDVRTGYTGAMMMNDQIHPNPLGEAHIANAFMSTYQSLADCSAD